MAAGYRKIVDERLLVPRARGGGVVRSEVWVDGWNQIARYNLAYINPLLYGRDNGRVLGYDSAHGVHHRHYKGSVTPVVFKSYTQIEACFWEEWRRIVEETQNAED